MYSDDELYHQYLSGDQSAGDSLMLRHGDALTAYLNAFLHNEQDAEDLMLDCFAVILVQKPKIQDGKFRPYLFKVARYKANHLWKIRIRRNEFIMENAMEDSLPGDLVSPENEVLKNERNRILEQCLNRIAPQYREILWLVYGMDMSYAQAAEVTGFNHKKIDNLLYHGKNQLRKELEKEGITHADI